MAEETEKLGWDEAVKNHIQETGIYHQLVKSLACLIFTVGALGLIGPSQAGLVRAHAEALLDKHNILKGTGRSISDGSNDS